MSTRSARRAQIALGVLWLSDGVLQFQPYMFGRTFVTGVLLPNAAGQPGVIRAPITWMAHVIEPRIAVFNAFAATLQVLIGLGLLHRPTVRPALALSLVWSIAIWFGGEGLGMLFAGSANPLSGAPGAALLYVAAASLCWPREPRAGSVDAGRESGLVGERGARIAWSAVWLGSAALWLLPANNGASAVHDMIAGAPSGAQWLSRLLNGAAAATAGQGTTIAIVLAAASATIGLAVLYGWHPPAFLAVQVAVLGLYWVLGQGLGGIFTGRATDVGTSPPMILVALIVMHQSAPSPTRVSSSRSIGTLAGEPG